MPRVDVGNAQVETEHTKGSLVRHRRPSSHKDILRPLWRAMEPLQIDDKVRKVSREALWAVASTNTDR